MSSVSEHVLYSLEKRAVVILQLVGKVVIEVSSHHIGWCKFLFSIPIDGVYMGLVIAKPGAPENAVNRQVVYFMKNHRVISAANFHLQALCAFDFEQVATTGQGNVSCSRIIAHACVCRLN